MGKVMLGELLVGAGLVSEEQVLAALRGQRGTGLPLGHYLVRSGVLAEDELVRALSQQLSVPIVLLDNLRLPDDALRKISADFARANLIVPFKLEGRTLQVATADPSRDDLLVELRISTHCDVRFSMAPPSSLDRALERGYGARVQGATVGAAASSTTSASGVQGAQPAPAQPPVLTKTTTQPAQSPIGAQAVSPSSSWAQAATATVSSMGGAALSFASMGTIETSSAALERRIAALEATVSRLVASVVKSELAKKDDFAGAPQIALKSRLPP